MNSMTMQYTDQPLAVLGGLTAQQFMDEYWQKKPLLVRNAMPSIVNLLVPDELKELATQDDVSARLLTQQGPQHEQWKVKNSPLTSKDFKKLPDRWTLLVQAVDHWSVDVAELWRYFDFIPQWRRDDIMWSYAPKGGSVGQHFDQYDVFLVQAYGSRRWQLGQSFGPETEFVPKQPLRLLSDMGEIIFDEVLEAGDLLYVPPALSHFGVAQNDCLTASFGFRMPSASALLERMTDQLLGDAQHQQPVADQARTIHAGGLVDQADLSALRVQLQQLIDQPDAFLAATMNLLSEPKYPDSLPEPEDKQADVAEWLLDDAVRVRQEPTARLLYAQHADQLLFWANGEPLCVSATMQTVVKQWADGQWISAAQLRELPILEIWQFHHQGLLLWDIMEEDE